jgi:hypothetical protein
MMNEELESVYKWSWPNPTFILEGVRKITKTTVKIAGVLKEISIKGIPNESLKCYFWINLFGSCDLLLLDYNSKNTPYSRKV